jgi:hypothetical protein
MSQARSWSYFVVSPHREGPRAAARGSPEPRHSRGTQVTAADACASRSVRRRTTGNTRNATATRRGALQMAPGHAENAWRTLAGASSRTRAPSLVTARVRPPDDQL